MDNASLDDPTFILHDGTISYLQQVYNTLSSFESMYHLLIVMTGAARLRTLKWFNSLRWHNINHRDVSGHTTLHSWVGHTFPQHNDRQPPLYNPMCIRDFLDLAPKSVTPISHSGPPKSFYSRVTEVTTHETFDNVY